MATVRESPSSRLGAAFRHGDRVMPLELFFDLVFVLAITQCTTLMAHDPTWGRIGEGMLLLALLWWSWVGYSWLTSVFDPEEGAIRLVLFAAMASFLIAAICVPEAFGGLATEFAIAYSAVRLAHVALFLLASRGDPAFRRSVLGLAVATTISMALLIVGSLLDTPAQVAVWTLALIPDMGIPYVFGAEGWRLVPGHFAERHGLIIIIALGESIVAIGVGAGSTLTWGVAAAATAGIAVVAAMWWMYFDVVALVSARRLASAEAGRMRNELARDSYSFIHFPMVAGIILFALGLKTTIGRVADPLDAVPAFALLGGVAIYLMGLVAFRYRHVHTLNRRRLALAVALFALIAVALEIAALAILAILAVLIWAVIAFETRGYGEGRTRVRHGEEFPAAR
ncbi:MAG: low temperature requirement protein A [Solirubrobacterales bacterium]